MTYEMHHIVGNVPLMVLFFLVFSLTNLCSLTTGNWTVWTWAYFFLQSTVTACPWTVDLWYGYAFAISRLDSGVPCWRCPWVCLCSPYCDTPSVGLEKTTRMSKAVLAAPDWWWLHSLHPPRMGPCSRIWTFLANEIGTKGLRHPSILIMMMILL